MTPSHGITEERKIHLCTAGQYDAVMDIWLAGNLAAHSFIPADYWHNQYPFVQSALQKSTVFVYLVNNSVRAFVGLPEPRFIAGLFVAPEWQGRGIGRDLLRHCKFLETELRLYVYARNVRAYAFYLRHGFRLEDERPDPLHGEMESLLHWRM